MRTCDFTPLWRSTIGFDRLFDLINKSVTSNGPGAYPPYDIVRTGEEKYRIVFAMAGFSPEEVTVTTQQNLLLVAARHADKPHQDFIHRGISCRAFERRISLADYVQVESANYENGLLLIDLVRRALEARKPRRIEIDCSRNAKAKAKPVQKEEVAVAA
jgi:molecular chaperone IbpA